LEDHFFHFGVGFVQVSVEASSFHECGALLVLDVKCNELAFVTAFFNPVQDADFVDLVVVLWLDCALCVVGNTTFP